jgi:hemolysin activation/secretion protein
MQLSTLGLFNVTILAMPLSSTRICTQNPHPQNCYHHHHHRQQRRQQQQHNLCTSPTTPTQPLHTTNNNTNTIFAHHQQQQSLSSVPSLSVVEEYVVSFTGACSSAAGI